MKWGLKVLIGLLFISAIVYAAPSYHVVRKGENLSFIGKNYNVSVKQLITWNHMTGSTVKIGQKIIVSDIGTVENVHKDKLAKSHKKKEKRYLAKELTSAEEGNHVAYVEKYHKVKTGESLSKIGRENGVSVSWLEKVNHLKTSQLKAGEVLIVRKEKQEIMPDVETKSETGIDVQPITTAAAGSSKVYYQVQIGDTLQSIAQKFKIDPDWISQNNLITDNNVKTGQIIVISTDNNNQEGADSDTTLSKTPKTYSNTNIDINTNTGATNTRNFSKLIANKIINAAYKFLGTPYHWGGTSKRGIDCSGLVKNVYGSIGIDLPRASREQYSTGEKESIAEAKPGDLVFFYKKNVTVKKKNRISHVGIYLGNNQFIHACKSEGEVVVSNLNEDYYKEHFAGARSYLAVKPEDENNDEENDGNN